MSFQAMTWAVKQKLPTNQKMVLLMLADRTNRDTGRCTPSHKNLAEDCGMSQATLKRCLAALADAGYISIQARTAEGVNLSNQYILHMSDDTNASVQNEGGGVTVNPGWGHSELGGGVTVSYKPGSINQEVEPKDCANKSRPPKRASQLPDDFEPNDTNHRVAAEHGVDIHQQLPQFRDYHRAKGSTMKDWHAALNTWIRNAKKFDRSTNHESRRHRKETPLEAGVRELQEMRERIAKGNIVEWLNGGGDVPFG